MKSKKDLSQCQEDLYGSLLQDWFSINKQDCALVGAKTVLVTIGDHARIVVFERFN